MEKGLKQFRNLLRFVHRQPSVCCQLAEQFQRSMIGFKTVQLLKDRTLGIGSYGRVCKAKCDQLICAAKVIHETLFNPAIQNEMAGNEMLKKPIRRFEQECEFMRGIRHPNIVQYLGLYEDPSTGLPALLMELMDENLTHFLESYSQPVPLHVQLQLCHDVALALAFLHSNNIIHRDLSSNNVLLIGKVRAKVTDFGMARLSDLNPPSTNFTLAKYPGTGAYMPPEFVRAYPTYSGKFDCFSFGVVTLQILTRRFPKPGDRHKTIGISDPRFPSGTIRVVVAEVKRRENHISQLDPNHPLRPVILHCLEDKDVNRPSSEELCDRIAALKESVEYSRNICEPELALVDDKEQEVMKLHDQLRSLKLHFTQLLEQRDGIVSARELEIQQLRQQMDKSTTHRGSSDQCTCIKEAPWRPTCRSLVHTSSTDLNLKWSKGIKAPSVMYRSCDAVVYGSTAYFKPAHTCEVYSYHTMYGWSHLPSCPSTSCSLAVVDGMLTAVGAELDRSYSNKLVSLTKKGSSRVWTEIFPPMPSKRSNTTALSADSVLIVIGGTGERGVMGTVEVMNTANYSWSTAADVPKRLESASGTVCDGRIYVMSTWSQSRAVYTCSLSDLLQSCRNKLEGVRHQRASWMSQASVWRRIADPPVTQSTCTSLHGQLLTVGGQLSQFESSSSTSEIHMYNTMTNSWCAVDHIPASSGRFACFAAVLPDNQLIVVGGLSDDLTAHDHVEIASTE